MSLSNNMGNFFDWLAKPMEKEDIVAWYLANNIIPEYTELFRDFCFSFYGLIEITYLGEENNDSLETKTGMTEQQKKEHFDWCLNKTIESFKKENIDFQLNQKDVVFFESFFFDTFYNQKDEKIKKTVDKFFKHMFDLETPKSKSDIEIFTELYKMLERSVKLTQ